MAIKYTNIKNGETRVAESEPMIAAMHNSSDLGPNAQHGQDFGWRLAPEVVVSLNRIKYDNQLKLEIASRQGVTFDEVDDKAILRYISDITDPENIPEVKEGDYRDAYSNAIRKLEEKEKARIAKEEKKNKKLEDELDQV